MIKSNKFNSRYFAPKKQREISERFLKYRNAEELAKNINFNQNNRFHVVIDGTFFFGDFIESFLVVYDIKVVKMTISTLSMNKNNVDSLANLLKGGYIDNLNLILSDYFYGHEKHDLIPYIYEKLDIDNKLQLSFAGTHCKICIFETVNNRKFVFHGSANLRSSSNIEQICLEENDELYNFYDEIQSNISETYKTINKSIRGGKLWQTLNREKVEDVQDVQDVQEQVKEHQYKDAEHLEEERSGNLRFKRIKF